MVSLSEAERTQIEATIADIERRTAAELVVIAIGRSSSYAEIKLGYGLALALGAGALGHLIWPQLAVAWLLWLQLAAALSAVALTSVPALLRQAVPKAVQQQAVDRRAALAFFEHALFATRDRTGVLILLSELEHRVVIMGDAGIHAKIRAEGWRAHVDHIVKAIHDGHAGTGVCETLRAIGDTLIAEFPPRADDVNELPNVVRQERL